MLNSANFDAYATETIANNGITAPHVFLKKYQQ